MIVAGLAVSGFFAALRMTARTDRNKYKAAARTDSPKIDHSKKRRAQGVDLCQRMSYFDLSGDCQIGVYGAGLRLGWRMHLSGRSWNRGTVKMLLMRRTGRVGVYLAVVLSAAAALPVLGQRTNGAGIQVPGKPPADVPPVAGKTLETRQAIGVGQEPAFAGQTRAVAVITKTPYAVKVMTTGLNQPWGMAFLPGGKVLVTEKVGTMRVIDMGTGKVEKSVVGMPVVLYGGDAGLLDVVLDPNFAENRTDLFFVRGGTERSVCGIDQRGEDGER